jgi:RNA polymerase nonessential primary-like sigma factor
MERVAMSSITEQLPRRAVEALTKETEQSTTTPTTKKQYKSSLDFAGTRVSREQEIHLARIIQQGVVLHKVRTTAEGGASEKSTLSRQEWADLAGLSATELRRRVIDYRKAKQALVTANLGLVHAVVNQQWPIYYKLGITKEELVQEGSLGLMRAAELFDPERGLRFSTYATIWTKASLSNSHLTELVRLPAREKTKWNKINRAHKDLEENGSKATVQELAAATGMSVDEVLETQRKMSQAQRVLSLDYEYNQQSRSGTQSTAMNTMENNKAFQEDSDLAEKTRMQADLVAAMTQNLTAREARLMRLRYGLSDGRPRSLAECADAMGLSQTRVQQLSKECLKKLREAAEAESLQEYLLTIA